EERCYPKILECLTNRRLMGTAIKGVTSTGSLEGKQADAVLDIYQQITATTSLLPPAIGFLFDAEQRTDQRKSDLVRRARGRMWFTQRRMYENYLLDSEAIVAVTSTIDGFRDDALTPEEIADWLRVQ